MKLTVRDAAKLLQTSEAAVHRWIREKSIPFHRVNDSYRFHRAELLEWATSRGIRVSSREFQAEEAENGAPMPRLADALEVGGVHYRVPGTDRASVLRAVVERMPIDPADRDLLCDFLLAREALGSTGVGEGIAIPHVRNPIVLNVDRPSVTLCFLEAPVDFDAIDGRAGRHHLLRRQLDHPRAPLPPLPDRSRAARRGVQARRPEASDEGRDPRRGPPRRGRAGGAEERAVGVTLLVVALGTLVGGGLLALVGWRSARLSSAIGAFTAVVGCIVGEVYALRTLQAGNGGSLSLRWEVPYGHLRIEADALSAFFLTVIFGLGAVAALYGAGYLATSRARDSGPAWLAFNVFLASMALVVVSRQAVLFLVAWEVMSLSAFVCITLDREDAEVARAGWVYLIASHVAAAVLVAFFLVFGREAHGFDFDALHAASPTPVVSAVLVVLALVGFGIKAGFVPLHVWLPEAHAAAPSHVSAVMSGVLIKMGLYGILRTVLLLREPPDVDRAGARGDRPPRRRDRDHPRLLPARHEARARVFEHREHGAHHPGARRRVLGVGTPGTREIAALAIAGALLHTWNHTLMKGLMFLAAGSVLHGSGTKDLERLGGAMQRMPRTGSLMLLGALAIAGLPPMNGFVSEWLLYLALMRAGIVSAGGTAVLALIAVGVVSLVGALAGLAFVRLIGTALLGQPRSEAGRPRARVPGAHGAPDGGPCPHLRGHRPVPARRPRRLLRCRRRAAAAVARRSRPPMRPSAPWAGSTRRSGASSPWAASRRPSSARGKRSATDTTWGCGYAAPSARMQYTARAFSELLSERLIPRSLRPRLSVVAARGSLSRSRHRSRPIAATRQRVGSTNRCSSAGATGSRACAGCSRACCTSTSSMSSWPSSSGWPGRRSRPGWPDESGARPCRPRAHRRERRSGPLLRETIARRRARRVPSSSSSDRSSDSSWRSARWLGPCRSRRAWLVPGGELAVRVDGLAAMFLVPLFVVAPLGSIYGLEYWPQRDHADDGRKLRLFYGLQAAGIGLVLVAANAVLFLVAWETMALAAFFCITTEDRDEAVRQTGYVYLVATRMGTLLLFAMFAVLHAASGTWDFAAPARSIAPSAATAVFVLALLGFGIKAGLMPLHVWLPGAHANAPSHVSALMSGVLIKTGIYGIARVCSFFDRPPIGWGVALLVAGAVSGVLGVAFAVGQHDLKRLLAYHSVENIGIITMGLGVAVLGRAVGSAPLVALGIAGALLHVWNHALFKALLFLSAGSVLHATGTREMDQLGGLSRRMPRTAFAFLLGAVAICGLPPLNGFVSELFVYLGLFHMIGSERTWLMGAIGAPALALIGALALACFVKAHGAVFLGQGALVTRHAALTIRAPRCSGRWCSSGSACAFIGLAPAVVSPGLERATAAWAPDVAAVVEPLDTLAPLHILSVTGVALLALAGAVAALLAGSSRRAPVASGPTWDCGYAAPSPRMQYTASSFAQTLVGVLLLGAAAGRPPRCAGRALPAPGVVPHPRARHGPRPGRPAAVARRSAGARLVPVGAARQRAPLHRLHAGRGRRPRPRESVNARTPPPSRRPARRHARDAPASRGRDHEDEGRLRGAGRPSGPSAVLRPRQARPEGVGVQHDDDVGLPREPRGRHRDRVPGFAAHSARRPRRPHLVHRRPRPLRLPLRAGALLHRVRRPRHRIGVRGDGRRAGGDVLVPRRAGAVPRAPGPREAHRGAVAGDHAGYRRARRVAELRRAPSCSSSRASSSSSSPRTAASHSTIPTPTSSSR